MPQSTAEDHCCKRRMVKYAASCGWSPGKIGHGLTTCIHELKQGLISLNLVILDARECAAVAIGLRGVPASAACFVVFDS